MIGDTGMIPSPKAMYVRIHDTLLRKLEPLTLLRKRTWQSDDDLQQLRTTDPGLAIAASVPVHRLGTPQEVANIVSM